MSDFSLFIIVFSLFFICFLWHVYEEHLPRKIKVSYCNTFQYASEVHIATILDMQPKKIYISHV